MACLEGTDGALKSYPRKKGSSSKGGIPVHNTAYFTSLIFSVYTYYTVEAHQKLAYFALKTSQGFHKKVFFFTATIRGKKDVNVL